MENEMYDEKGFLKPEFEMPAAEKRQYNNNIIEIDKIKNIQKIIDKRTDYGKGIRFMSVDGTEWPTYEQAMAYNKEWYDKMFPKIDKQDSQGLKR